MGGYNEHFINLAQIVGILGIPFGFFGFLGVYDDKPSWIRVFFHYLQIKLLCTVVVFLADCYTLRGCEDFKNKSYEEVGFNTALLELSSHGMCHWGRIAYYIGFVLSFIVDLYMLYNVWKYTAQLELNPPYPIDFGYEKYDAMARWQFYEVAEPEEIPMYEKAFGATYGTDEKVDEFKDRYGPDGVKAKPSYAPDGMRGPAYVRATV